MEIISVQNEKVKMVASLAQKKYRDKMQLFVCEGQKLIDEALSSGYKMSMFFYTKKEDGLLYNVKEKYRVSEKVMQKMSGLSTGASMLATFIQKDAIKDSGGRYLVLENIQDAGNFGAIIRSAHACEFLNIYALNCVDMYDIKCLRASMGAIFKVNIINCSLEKFKTLGKKELVCASMEGENIYSSKNKFSASCGVVLGNEGHGVSDALRALCSKTISLPMKAGQESLNVAVSASLIMYAIRYNLKQS